MAATKLYNLFLTDGTLDLQIDEGTVVSSHGLRFDGYQKPAYGERRNNNLLHLVENFASEEDPSNVGNPLASIIDSPLAGQFWFDKTNTTMKIFNGSDWVVLSSDIFAGPGTPYSVLDDTASDQLTLTKNTGLPVIIDNIASLTDLNEHIADASDAHDSSAISFTPTGSIPGTNVQDAIVDVQDNLNAHLVDATAAHAASAISLVPYGSVGSTTVQAAIAELEVELNTSTTNANNVNSTNNAHIADAVDAHDASAISFNPVTSGFTSNNVQDAIEELNDLTNTLGDSGVVDSLRAVRSGAQTVSTTAPSKILFNSVQFGDDFGQFNIGSNRYIAAFPQVVRVRASVGVTSINDENRLIVYIRKNGSDERNVSEWKWPESADIPGDKECSCLLVLNENDYVEAWCYRVGGGSPTANLETDTGRTFMEVDIIKSLGSPPAVSDVRLTDQTISASAISPASATASITVRSDGDLSAVGSVSPGFNSDEWHVSNPSGGIGANYQVRLVTNAGTLTTGTADTWLSLSSNRTFGVTQPGSIGSKTFSGTLQIRDTATMTIQDQASLDLSAIILK